MKFLKLLFRYNWLLSFYFNFKYLPIRQAIMMPIFLSKPKLIKCKGTIKIEADLIKPGIIRLGENRVSLYPNSGIIWENHGGEVVFTGNCCIGNSSAISIGKYGSLKFGLNFSASVGFRITSYYKIVFGDFVLVSWDVLVTDTSFHKIIDLENNKKNIGFADIYINNNNWITSKCIILPGTKTPANVVFGSGSIINKDYTDLPNNILLAGNPLSIKKYNVYRDPMNHIIDEIEYLNK